MKVDISALDKQEKIYKVVAPFLKNPQPVIPQHLLGGLLDPIPGLMVLEQLGHQTLALSVSIPTLRNALEVMLEGYMNNSLYDLLSKSFKNIKERYVSDPDNTTFIHIFTEKAFEDFVKLASKVAISERNLGEQTLSFELLFSTDTKFDPTALPCFNTSSQLRKYLSNKQTTSEYYDDKHCYFLSILTHETSTGIDEYVRDYILYTPTSCYTRFE